MTDHITPRRAEEPAVMRYLAPVGTYLLLPEEDDAVDVSKPLRLVGASAYDTLAQRVRELEGALHVAEGMKNSAIEAGAASLRATAEVLGLPDAPMKLEDLAALRMSELTAATQRLDAIDAACLAVCKCNSPAAVDEPDPDLGRYVCMNENGDPLIDTDDPAEVIRALDQLWLAVSNKLHAAAQRAEAVERTHFSLSAEEIWKACGQYADDKARRLHFHSCKALDGKLEFWPAPSLGKLRYAFSGPHGAAVDTARSGAELIERFHLDAEQSEHVYRLAALAAATISSPRSSAEESR